MINNTFYNSRNTEFTFLGGKVRHYPIKNPSVTLQWYEYVLKKGETLYSISAKLFGKNLDYMWTYIADNNILKHPDDWKEGDVIRLPKVIIRDSDTRK